MARRAINFRFRDIARPERNDCVPVALAKAADIPYQDAYELAAMAGRKPRGFCNINTLMDGLGYELAFYGTGRCGGIVKSTTLAVLMTRPEMQTGRFVFHRRGHAFAVVDGVVFDSDLKPWAPVRNVWRVA